MRRDCEWLPLALGKLDKIRCESIEQADCKRLARLALCAVEFDEKRAALPVPSIWKCQENGFFRMLWKHPLNSSRSMELVFSVPGQFQILIWTPGKPAKARVCRRDYAEVIRQLIAELMGAPLGELASDVSHTTV